MSTGLRRRRGGSPEAAPKRVLPAISLESFDLYTKVRDEGDGDTTVQTSSGAAIALLSLVLCLVLAFFELRAWLVPVQREHMVVDPIVEDRLRINFDITFPSLTCAEANLDAMDVAGEQQNGLAHDILKMRLDSQGNPIGDAYAHACVVHVLRTCCGILTPVPCSFAGWARLTRTSMRRPCRRTTAARATALRLVEIASAVTHATTCGQRECAAAAGQDRSTCDSYPPPLPFPAATATRAGTSAISRPRPSSASASTAAPRRASARARAAA